MRQTADTVTDDGAFRLGDWLVEPSLNRITRGADSVQLEPKAMDVLVFLASHSGEVMSHEAIIDGVWSEEFVGEGVLRRAITVLREALGDDARNPSYIETITKRGYRLIADITRPERASSPGTDRRAKAFRPRWTHGLAIGIAAVIALLVVLPPEGIWQRITGVSDGPLVRSIAVLPRDNLSGDPEQEYFADAQTEELITELARIGGFDKVISRTSSMRFRGTDKVTPVIARELGVDAILEGGILHTGDRVRITAQLIHAPTDTHLWAGRYERNVVDVIALQREIAGAIATTIRIELTPEDELRLASSRPVNPEAYRAYLMGRYHLNLFGGPGFENAREYFEEAVALDPEWAPAYAGLSIAYSMMVGWKQMPAQEMETARKYALAAIGLDDTLSEAHVAMGMVKAQWDWDWERSEVHARRAIELEPSSSTAHSGYTTLLMALRRFDEAVEHGRRALDLDPFNPATKITYALALTRARRYDEAIPLLHEALEMVPGNAATLMTLFRNHLANQRFDEALAMLERHDAAWLKQTGKLEEFREVCSTRGWRAAMEWRAGQGELGGTPDHLWTYRAALFYCLAGQCDKAMPLLERACESRSQQMLWVYAEPAFEPLRSDPRFQDLLRRMNYPVD